MKRARRGLSLFWTIAAIFLLTILLGTLGQWFVAVGVLRPLELREARARAEAVAAGLAWEIAALPPDAGPAGVDSLLATHRGGPGARIGWILFRASDGTIHADPPWRGRQLPLILSGRPLPMTQPGDGPRPGEGPGEGARRGAFRFFRPEVLARRNVMRGDVNLGEVFVVRPGRPPAGPGQPGSPTPLLVLPIALIASAFAGLVLVRILVRRLRAMETLAARVADGDLSVRIGDKSGDEIGRLAERLDLMTERLSEARTRLEEAGNQRRQLFADITHELATPLTSIRGYTETLLDPGVPLSEEERSRYLRSVQEESRRLDRLISDLFELARLEAGASPLALEPIDWASLCRNTLERFEPRFQSSGLKLVWGESVPAAVIEADGRRMEQALENLLVNALRYVQRGGAVTVALTKAAGGPGDRGPAARGPGGGAAPRGPGRYRLTVSDDGPGLPPEELPRVFERFYRAAGTREQGGSGLGLAIVREIVERHGGTARAEALSPHGLSIQLEIPARE